jgi:phosphoglycolate phosphatase
LIDLVVFDLDGTLVDSGQDLTTGVNRMLGWCGAPPLPEQAVVGMVGDGASVLVRRALEAAGVDPGYPGAYERFLAAYDECLLECTRPYKGIPEALAQVGTGRRLAVLTNKPTGATTRILEALGLRPFFASVVGADTPHGRKPDPAGLLHLIREAGVTPAATVLVGDSPIDLETARRAGTGICLARYGFGFRFDDGAFRGDELFIERPLELMSLIDCLSARRTRASPTRTA